MTIGKKIAILVEQGFEEIELLEPMRALKELGGKVTLVGSEADIYRGKKNNTEVKADRAIRDVKAEEFDAVIIPGGHAPDRMRLNPAFAKFVKKADELHKIIGAICHGPQLLISAGVVNGKRVTSWPSISVDLINAGSTWEDKPVVVDDNIITSRKPADLPFFEKAVIKALGE